MATRTYRGVECPWPEHEGDGLTQHVALVALGSTLPHRYAVCTNCYLKQWRIAYPDSPEPEL